MREFLICVTLLALILASVLSSAVWGATVINWSDEAKAATVWDEVFHCVGILSVIAVFLLGRYSSRD